MTPFWSTIFFGGGLLFCGFELGRTHWLNKGATRLLNELLNNKLCDPLAVTKHLQSKGAKVTNAPKDSNH